MNTQSAMAVAEASPRYLLIEETMTREQEDYLIQRALDILMKRMKTGPVLDSPNVVKQYLRLKLAPLEHEEFVVLFIDNQRRLIAMEQMFRGTITQTSVYPREVVKRALFHNAEAVIFAHGHPSGHCEPSYADQSLTQVLKSALKLVDVQVIDHIVVGLQGSTSMAERGMV